MSYVTNPFGPTTLAINVPAATATAAATAVGPTYGPTAEPALRQRTRA